MRPMLFALLVGGLLGLPMLTQSAAGQKETPKTEPGAKPGGDVKKEEPKKGDQDKGGKDDPKKDDKGKDEPKTGEKELKIFAQGPFTMQLPPPDPSSAQKSSALVLHSAKDMFKIPPFDKFGDKVPMEFEKMFSGMLEKAL